MEPSAKNPTPAHDPHGKPLTPAGTLDWRRLHLWQLQPVRDLLILAGILGLIYLGYVLRLVTVPLLLALLLAYLVEPIVRKLTSFRTASGRRVMSRQGVVVGLIALTVLGVLIPVGIGIGFAAVQGAALAAGLARNASLVVDAVNADTPEEREVALARLPSVLQHGAESLTSLKKDADAYRQFERERNDELVRRRLEAEEHARFSAEYPDAVKPETAPPNPADPPETADPLINPADDWDKREPPVPAWRAQLYDAAQGLIRWVNNNAQTVARQIGQEVVGTGAQAVGVALAGLAGLAWLLFTAFLTAFFFFFFSTGFGRVVDFWESLIPERKKGRSIDLIQKMDRVIAGFVRGRLIICALVAVWTTVHYLWIGVPAPLILGPLIGVMFLVPYMAGVALPIVIVLTWIDPSSSAEWQRVWWWIIFAPIVVHMTAQLLDDYILSPIIQGKTTDMDTPTILFASIAGGVLAGVYGLLIAIPAAACLKILLKEVFWPKFSTWAQGKDKDFLPISRD